MNYQRLFDHMEENHGLTLIETEMIEICNVVNEMQKIGEQQSQLDISKVTCVEVISHIKGRPYFRRAAKDAQVQFQDEGRTLKIFLM